MSEVLDCKEITEKGLIERYAAGTLPGPEAEALEDHYLTCKRCQNELRLATAIRSELPKLEERSPRKIFWVGPAVGLAAAAVLAALVLLPGDAAREELGVLGGVAQPPLYLGVPIRAAAPGPADSLFAAAMQSYTRGDYAAAADGLQQALAAGVDSLPALFFLGASQLMRDRPAEAAQAFQRVAASGDSPYRAEALYYEAKALLRLGRAEAALQQLRAAAQTTTGISAGATALADSVEILLRR